MNRLFFRFFILVMLAVSLATLLVYGAIALLFGDPLDDIARGQAAAQIFLLEQYIDQAPADEWLVRLNKVREVSQVRFDLIPLAQAEARLSSQKQQHLARGELVIDPVDKAFYRRVDLAGDKYIGSDAEVVHAQALPVDLGRALAVEALRYVIVALALLVPIALWSRSHWQALQRISGVADRVGEGDLTARVHIAPSASVYPLAEHLNRMAGRIETLVGAQQHLLHSVSHELRTPIARLTFGLELLQQAAGGSTLTARIEAMHGDVDELNDLVNELLSMSKLERRQGLQAQPFDLLVMLRTTLDAHRHALLEHAVTLAVGADCAEIVGDERLLARAVANLVKNAARYAAGRIALSARRLDARTLELTVEDDGPGIPPEERERIFEPFYRLDRSRDRATGGFGLGLAIVQKAAALHDGRVEVGESPLGGAGFSILLPIRSRAPVPGAPPVA